MQTIGLVFAYFGPETVMPVTSIIATVGALAMMFGKTLVRFTVGWIRTIGRTAGPKSEPPAPHFTVGRRQGESTAAEAADYALDASE